MTCDTCGTATDGLGGCPTCSSNAPPARRPAVLTLLADERLCPMCAETIKATAIKCRYCGGVVSGALDTAASTGAGLAPRPTAGIMVNAPSSGSMREQPSIVIQNVQSVSPAGAMPFRAKSPGLAVVLSFLLTGLGQFYNGDIGKGLLFMLAQSINVVLMFFAVGFFTGFVTWVYAMVDAHNSAVRINVRGY